MIRQFRGSILFTLLMLVLAGLFGWYRGGGAGAAEVLWIVSVLAVLEVSLSFDNAVVNAAVLRDMDPVWRRRFLTWGMLIAVFGMRIVFPLGIVGVAAGIGPIEALELSLRQPQRYEEILTGAHLPIAGFGGAFLLMVGFGFFFDADKDVHWIGRLERTLSKFGTVEASAMALVVVLLLAVAHWLAPEEALRFVTAGLFGLVAFVAVEGLGHMLGGAQDDDVASGPTEATKAVARSGLGAFLYLNLLDASFSFDGVIGAFALSNSMPVIAIGLSIGAMAVRSLTLVMVERETLAQYRYLEHGAFWAIIALGALMLVSALVEVPEAITGLIGAALIGLSLWWSVRVRRLAA